MAYSYDVIVYLYIFIFLDGSLSSPNGKAGPVFAPGFRVVISKSYSEFKGY